MPLDRWDRLCERGIIVLVLAALVVGPLAMGAERPPEFTVIQFLVSAAVLLWLIRIWLNRNYRLLWPPICWAVAAFVLLAIVRYRQADLEYVARQELVRVLVYALVFFVILNNLAAQEATQLVSHTWLFLAMPISFTPCISF